MADAEYTHLLESDLRDAREYIRDSNKLMDTVAAELTRLRAIEAAAREYREAWESDAIGDRDAWTITNRDARSRLFALLDDKPE